MICCSLDEKAVFFPSYFILFFCFLFFRSIDTPVGWARVPASQFRVLGHRSETTASFRDDPVPTRTPYRKSRSEPLTSSFTLPPEST